MVMKIGGGLFLPPRVPPSLMLLVIVMGRRTLVDDPIPIAISAHLNLLLRCFEVWVLGVSGNRISWLRAQDECGSLYTLSPSVVLISPGLNSVS